MTTKYKRVQGWTVPDLHSPEAQTGTINPAVMRRGYVRKQRQEMHRQGERRADLLARFRAKVSQPTGAKLEALDRKRFRGYIKLLSFDGLEAVMEMPELPTWAAYAILHEVDSRAVPRVA